MKGKYIVLLVILLLFSACSQSPKSEFISAYQSLEKEDYTAGEFESVVSDVQMELSDDLWINIYLQNLKNTSAKGRYQYDGSGNSQVLVEVDTFGETMPFEERIVAGVEYKSASWTVYSEIVRNMGFQSKATADVLTKLEGKYLINEPLVGDQQDSKQLDNQENHFLQLLKRVEEDHFEKEGDLLTCQLTENQVHEAIGELSQGSLQQSRSLELELNKKTKEMKGTIRLANDEISSAIDIRMKPRKSEGTITAPKEKDILERSEMLAIIQETLKYEGINEQLSPMQFDLLYQKLTEDMDQMEDAEKQRRLEEYAPYLSEEQLDSLRRLFGEVLE